MTRPLLLVAALTLCCCITTMHAFSRLSTCHCIRTTSSPVHIRVIEKIEMFPISGSCRRTEIIITRKNGSKVCINPKMPWINNLFNEVQKRNGISDSTTESPTASTTDY